MTEPEFRDRIKSRPMRTRALELRRAKVEPPRPAPGAWRTEEEQRRPVAAELRRIYEATLRNLATVILLLIAGLTITYISSHIVAPVHPLGFIHWVHEKRDTWKTEILLGVPVTVLFPSVLTSLFSSAPKEPETVDRSPRDEAFLEVVRNVLYVGLMLSAGFALLAAIPGTGSYDLPLSLLAIAISAGCLFLSVTLRAEGTEKDLLVAKAEARREAATRSQLLLREHLQTHAPWSTPLLSAGWRSSTLVMLLGMALIAVIPTIGFSIWIWIWSFQQGQQMSPLPTAINLISLGGYLGAQAIFIIASESRRHLATTRRELLSARGFLFVPIIVFMAPVLALVSNPVTHTARNLLGMLAITLFLSDLFAFSLSLTLFGTIVDYRGLDALRSYSASQVEYLSENLRKNRPARVPLQSTRLRRNRSSLLQVKRSRAASCRCRNHGDEL